MRGNHQAGSKIPAFRPLQPVTLALEPFQLLPHLCSAHLGIASCGLDGRSTFDRHMSEIVGNLFQCPSGFSRAMCEIMAQIIMVLGKKEGCCSRLRR